MDLVMPALLVWKPPVASWRKPLRHRHCYRRVPADSSKVFEAMGAGALDAVNTPALGAIRLPGGPPTVLLAEIETIHRIIGARPAGRPLGVAA